MLKLLFLLLLFMLSILLLLLLLLFLFPYKPIITIPNVGSAVKSTILLNVEINLEIIIILKLGFLVELTESQLQYQNIHQEVK